jgi:hypothetical protein
MFSFTELRNNVEVNLENKTIIEKCDRSILYEDLLVTGCVSCTGCVPTPNGGWTCESCVSVPCPKDQK